MAVTSAWLYWTAQAKFAELAQEDWYGDWVQNGQVHRKVAASAAMKMLDARISHDHLVDLSILFAVFALVRPVIDFGGEF